MSDTNDAGPMLSVDVPSPVVETTPEPISAQAEYLKNAPPLDMTPEDDGFTGDVDAEDELDKKPEDKTHAPGDTKPVEPVTAPPAAPEPDPNQPTPDQVAQWQQQANAYAELQAHIASLPPEQQEAIAVAAGLRQAAVEVPERFNGDGDLEDFIAPHLPDMLAAPQRISSIEQGMQAYAAEVSTNFTNQSHAIDNAWLNASIAQEQTAHFASLLGYEVPQVDNEAILAAMNQKIQSGIDPRTAVKAAISEALKPTFDKNTARQKQSRASRPSTPSHSANGNETITKGMSMAQIHAIQRRNNA